MKRKSRRESVFSDNEYVLRSPATGRRDKRGFMWELEPTQEPGAAVSRRASLGANKRRGPQNCAQRVLPRPTQTAVHFHSTDHCHHLSTTSSVESLQLLATVLTNIENTGNITYYHRYFIRASLYRI